MKNLSLIILLFFIVCSCGSNQESINKMADDMCSAMEHVDANDQQSLLDAANRLLEISAKEDLYKDVTLNELENSMKEKCPKGWDNYILLSKMGSK